MEIIAQIAIVCFGLPALLLMQSIRTEIRRWGPVLGCCGQPFWWYTTLHNDQYGVFVLTFAYTIVWVLGLTNYWIRPWLISRK